MKRSVMKKPRAKKKPLEAPSRLPEVPPREVDDYDPIRPGDIVMLPDGALAAVEKIVGTDAYVIEWTKQLGRGPWIYPISDLVSVT